MSVLFCRESICCGTIQTSIKMLLLHFYSISCRNNSTHYLQPVHAFNAVLFYEVISNRLKESIGI
jgi:hypothetical protein